MVTQLQRMSSSRLLEITKKWNPQRRMREQGDSGDRGKHSLLQGSEILRLSSKEAQLKQFKAGVLIWRFPAWEENKGSGLDA